MPECDPSEGEEGCQPADVVAHHDGGRITTGDIECDLARFVTLVAVPAPAAASHVGPAPSAAPSSARSAHMFARRAAALAVLGVAAAVVVAIPHTAPPPSPPQARASQGRPQLAVSVFPAAAGLDCRLAISALSDDHTTGFIVFGAGRARFTSVQTPGTTYVPALNRWVDVLPQMVAPDGRSYVTQDVEGGSTTIDIVDTHGDRRLVRTTEPVNVFAFTSTGILLNRATTPAPGPATLDLGLLDPATGKVRPFPQPVPQWGDFRMVPGEDGSATYLRSGDALWLTGYDPASESTTVWRYDLGTRVTTQWFDGSTDGRGHVQVVAGDAQGLPIVQLSAPDLFHTNPAHRDGIEVQTLLLTSPHRAAVLNHGVVGAAGIVGSLSPLSITHGNEVWLASDDGAIWLYRPSAGLEQVAKVTTSAKGAPGIAISGPCA